MQNLGPISHQLGETAPDFTATTTMGVIRFHEWLGNSWCVLFSHPKDFTPVCTTELGVVAKLKSEWDKRGVKVIAISVNELESHLRWIKDINETQQTSVNFPLIADANKEVSQLYGMIHPLSSDTATVRSVFIIDSNRKIRLMLIYPASTGRNFQEIIRTVDSLQLTDRHKVATPANWKQGEPCIILPSVTDPEELKRLFPQGYREERPYLRYVDQPK